MSKAFTKEDDDAATMPVSPAQGLEKTRFRLTSAGARRLASAGDPRSLEALRHAELVELPAVLERAALGVSVEVETEGGDRRIYRLVSAEERALVGDGCSVLSPMGRALLGARPDDVREVAAPRGTEELRILALHGDPEGPPARP